MSPMPQVHHLPVRMCVVRGLLAPMQAAAQGGGIDGLAVGGTANKQRQQNKTKVRLCIRSEVMIGLSLPNVIRANRTQQVGHTQILVRQSKRVASPSGTHRMVREHCKQRHCTTNGALALGVSLSKAR